MPSLSSKCSSTPDELSELLKAVEDQVRQEFEARESLYRLVAYKYLNASGLRISTIDAEIRRELEKSGAH